MTQVSRSTKTLLVAIRDGDVPAPALMGWNAWQRWRKGVGKRPVVATDGEATTTTLELQLWKSVMLEQYGETWSVDLLSSEVEEPPPQVSVPSPVPAATAEIAPATPRPRAEASPGSGPPGAASPGSGTGTPSWKSADPGSPGQLTARVFRGFKPDKETIQKYSERVVRQAKALDQLGESLISGTLEVVLKKAGLEMKVFMEARDEPEKQLQILRRELMFEMMDIDGTEDQVLRTTALEEMVVERGGDLTAIMQGSRSHG
jgi:hypothetical protein